MAMSWNCSGSNWRSSSFMLAQVVDVIELIGSQIGLGRVNFGQDGFAQNIGRDILDRGTGDFVDEADICVFA